MSESLIPRRDDAPHRAVIWLSAEVHRLNPNGECCGDPSVKVAQFPVYLDGADRFIAERKLNELLAEVKEKCRTPQSST